MFALADCNNFYASCEEAFNPSLSHYPLIVLSNNDGCVIARSKKAKELGIRIGDPAYLYKDRVENNEIRMLSSNFALYGDMSFRVMQILQSSSPNIEIYSIDEAFYELEEMDENRYRKEALQLSQKVYKWTGIPISIGIGPTKTLAKLANELAKKGPSSAGVHILINQEQIRSQLKKTQLKDIWGIGDSLAHRLKCKQIYTAEELINADDQLIKKLLGVTGFRTALELRGISCFPCNELPENKKSIVCSRSFPNPISNRAELEEAVSSFASQCAEKLRKQHCQASFLSVFIATSPFIQPYESASTHIDLPNPSSYTPELIHLAKEGVQKIYKEGFKYKKAGVMISHFCDEKTEQTDWITPQAHSAQKTVLMQTIDRINRRYDKNTIRFAAEGVDYSWKSERSYTSPRYTTSWNELLIVK